MFVKKVESKTEDLFVNFSSEKLAFWRGCNYVFKLPAITAALGQSLATRELQFRAEARAVCSSAFGTRGTVTKSLRKFAAKSRYCWLQRAGSLTEENWRGAKLGGTFEVPGDESARPHTISPPRLRVRTFICAHWARA